MKKGFAFFLSVLLLALVGCGDKIGLSGKVTYSDDGSPLPAGTVCFETDSYLARGTLQPDGTYQVGSLSEKDGLPAGTYRVYVSGATKDIGVDKGGMPITESLISDKFASGSTSGMTLTVPAANGRFDFQVDRYVPKPKK